MNNVYGWEHRKPHVGDFQKYARRRASYGDVPTVVDPDLSSPDIASSERKRQRAPISRRCIEISLLWFWERCIRELDFWWFAKRVVGFIFITLSVLAVIPVLVPTKHAARLARLTDTVSVTFCSIPVNHHMCGIICAAPQAANVFMSVCGETSYPQDICQLMVDTNQRLASSLNSSSYLHPLPHQLRSLKGAAERMSDRFRWHEHHSSFKIPKSSAILDGLEAFILASGTTPWRIETYLFGFDARIEIFMHNNRYIVEFAG